MGSYVPTTAAEREEMLALIGVDSLEGLYKAVPQVMLLRSPALYTHKFITIQLSHTICEQFCVQ